MIIGCYVSTASAQTKIELYNLVKEFLTDSTGYENVGDWAAGEPKKFAIKWKADQIEMSDDTAINFFRQGTANITIKGKSYLQAGQPVKWNVMLKGPRMGYTSFSIVSSASAELKPKMTIDSIFGKKPFNAKLLRSCDSKTQSGYYYYELKLPKEDMVFLKLSWLSINGNTAIRIDCYNHWSSHAAKLDCPK